MEKTLAAPTHLLVGKSLGSLAADRKLPAVWLTPLLHRPEVVDALGRVCTAVEEFVQRN